MTDRQKRTSGVTEKVTKGKAESKPDFSFAKNLTEAAVKKFGSTYVKGYDDFMGSIYGVPIYNNLALQYLIGVDVIPLGRLLNVVGPFGVTKSNFCWYLAALFLRYGGYIAFIDSERKSNPDQINSLLNTYLNFDQLPEDKAEWFVWEQATTLDQLLDYNVFYVKQLEEFGGKKINRPVLFLNDSLGSVTSEDAGEKRMNDEEIKGFAAARNAAKLSEDMQVFGPRLFDLPATCLMINHQKVKLEQEGQMKRASYLPPVKSEKGGEHQRFAYSLIFELNPLRKDKVSADGVQTSYPCYKMTLKKNSLGSNRPHIEVPYRYLWQGTGKGDELIWYDWNASLVLLLTDEKLFDIKSVAKVVDITSKGAKYSSDRLGLSGVTITELGAAMHLNKAVYTELQDKILCIRRKESYGRLIEGIDRDQVFNNVRATEDEDVGTPSGDKPGQAGEEI